jgi:hypothetical protein
MINIINIEGINTGYLRQLNKRQTCFHWQIVNLEKVGQSIMMINCPNIGNNPAK